jgi:signal transduction histidine kinase
MDSNKPPAKQQLTTPLNAQAFDRHFRWLILATWMVPPALGLSYILYIGLLSLQQMFDVIASPIEIAYILGWLFFAVWYFPRYVRPIRHYIASSAPTAEETASAIECLKGFTVHYWVIFVFYLLMAPPSVVLAAWHHSDYQPSLIGMFRMMLVALIVAIIVGLPTFFMLLDLFGRALSRLRLSKPHVTIRTKVFLIGALIPLLIDTMLVQYYWSRTGFFTLETFMIWLSLEFLAIAGSLIFVRSFAQSLHPLEKVIQAPAGESKNFTSIYPLSTDELGVLAQDYRLLLTELDEYKYQLETKVRQRTSELEAAQQELLASERLATLGELTATVSHELRNPLAAIQASLYTLEKSVDINNERAVDSLARIKRGMKRCDHIVEELLDYTRSTEVDLLPTVLDEWLSNVIDDFRFPEEIQVTMSPGLGQARVMLDSYRLQRALYNVIDNAVQELVSDRTRSIQPSPRIDIISRLDNKRVEIVIRDNGSGISEEILQKLFEPLFSTKGFGIGLGMPIVRKIMQLHDGDIEIHTQPEQGTEVILWLPGTTRA